MESLEMCVKVKTSKYAYFWALKSLEKAKKIIKVRGQNGVWKIRSFVDVKRISDFDKVNDVKVSK